MRRFYCRSRDHSCCLNNTLEMLPYLEFILLYVSLFSKISAGSNPCRTSFSVKDHVLIGHVMRTLNHKTFESCTFSCELEPQCFSVNYISLHKTCQLNNATKEYFSGDLVQQKGAFYMGMVVRSYNTCESMRCENGGTCVSSPSLTECKCVDGFTGFHCENLQALGMQSGAIPDGSIQASSTKPEYDAWKGRLNGQSCWMPAQNDNTVFIKVIFVTKVTVVAIATQGAPLDGCWVKTYKIRYGRNNIIVNDVRVSLH
ncbi:EGF-like repeat and discoidin I-like domain-containing protein 3 isoform X3 [Oculina patagonica]